MFYRFCQPYKTPNESKNNKEIKRVGFNSTALLAAFGAQFTWFSESDIRPRHFQGGRI
jgi:hypothetical protein